ncbi:MAGE family protein [Xylariomycetidae sp. FL0641]|nr:MAGE family protein [Xylariomycetidae sp. FL0641]
MPTQSHKRRRTEYHDPVDDDPPRRRQVRREVLSEDESDPAADDTDADADPDTQRAGPDDQLVKKLVRYALACEYARMPIRRDGIRDKVLGSSNARAFRRVFDAAQEQLQSVFGMEMEELPTREKRTLKEKQKATARKAASQAAATSRQYVLVSTLPMAYKPRTTAPSRLPDEGSYVGLYTLIIALIHLTGGGQLSDHKLRRHLGRLNAAQNTPVDRTDAVLARLVRQGYLDRVVVRSDAGDDDQVSWAVGPRGRVEVPPHAVADLVTHVWGPEPPVDLDKRIQRSLGVERTAPGQLVDGAGGNGMAEVG